MWQIYEENLTALSQDIDFFLRIIYYWDPLTKQESVQKVHKDFPPSKNLKTQSSAKMVMTLTFWDSEGALLIKYMSKGTKITGNVYKNTIGNLKNAIHERQVFNFSQKTFLLHETADWIQYELFKK